VTDSQGSTLEIRAEQGKAEARLTGAWGGPSLVDMEVHLAPDVEQKLKEVAAETGRAADALVEDALTGYFEELRQLRTTLDERYDDLKSGRVQPLDGEAFFEALRRRGEDQERSPQ
jgi:hypothetical protein